MSLPRYPEYIQSGADWMGEIPRHWNVRRLGYFLRERREKVSDVDFAALSVTKKGIVPQLETAAKTDDNDNRKKVCAGDFVINSRSDRKGSSGLSSLDGSVSLINTILVPGADVVGRFVHHLLRSELFQEEFYRFGKGIVSDLWSTNYSEMRSIPLAVPPIPEQMKIAAFLDMETAKIDSLVFEQEKLIALLKEKRQAVISHAVTKGLNPDAPMKPSGIEWLGDVPAHWRVEALANRFSVQLGKMLDSRRITGRHLRSYLRVADVQWGQINTDDLPLMDFDEEGVERYSLQPGDLLVNEGGSYPGRAAVWDAVIEGCYYQKALHRVRAHSQGCESPKFLYYVFRWAANSGVFTAGGNETTIEHLPAEKLRRYRFAFPPLSEQLAIAAYLDGVVGAMASLEADADLAIHLLKERRAGLISAAVTGQIDVRGT